MPLILCHHVKEIHLFYLCTNHLFFLPSWKPGEANDLSQLSLSHGILCRWNCGYLKVVNSEFLAVSIKSKQHLDGA